MRKKKVDPRLLAFFTGVALFLVAPFYALVLGDYAMLSMPVNIALYAISGFVFGYFWEDLGWRLGLWLFGFWFFVLPFGVFVSRQYSREGMLVGLLLILGLGVAGCVGSALGAAIKRRRSTNPHPG